MGNTSKSVKEIPVKWIRKLTRDPNEIDLVVHYICKHGQGRYQVCAHCDQERIDWYEVRIVELEEETERLKKSRDLECKIRDIAGRISSEMYEARVAELEERHQVAPMAVACGLEPDATLDELYERMRALCGNERRLSCYECVEHAEPMYGECDDCDKHNPEPPEQFHSWS